MLLSAIGIDTGCRKRKIINFASALHGNRVEMKKEELKCKHCNSDLQFINDDMAECVFCRSKFRLIKAGIGDDYKLEAFIDFENITQTNQNDPNTVSNRYSSQENSSNNSINTNSQNMSGNKRSGVGVGGIMIALLILLTGVVGAVTFGVFTSQDEKTVDAEVQEVTEAHSETEAATNSTDYLPKSRMFQAFVTGVFDKRLGKISQEELNQIKYMNIYSYDEEELAVEYSFEDYYSYNGVFENTKDTIYISEEQFKDYSDLSCFKGLTDLSVDYRKLKSGDLDGLTNLRGLSSRTDLYELTNIVNPEQLWYLKISSSINDLGGIEKFKNLEEFYVKSNILTDISKLQELPNLYYLTLEGCDLLNDFSILSEMSSLESVSLDTEGLKDINFVTSLPFLQYLTLIDTKVRTLEPLNSIHTLIYLELEDNDDILDLSPIQNQTNLETLVLDIGYNQTMPDLSNLTKLTQLWLASSDDISSLSSLKNLEILILDHTDISQTSVFTELTALKKLKLEDIRGDFTSVSFLTKLPALEWLDISGNTFYMDISDIFKIQSLETLFMDDCSFELNTSKISEQTSLKQLSIDNAKVYENIIIQTDQFMTNIWYDDCVFEDKLPFLANFPNIEYLELKGNQLTKVDDFLSLQNLQYLVVDDNYITDVQPLEQLPNLFVLYCADNAITNYGNLKDTIWVID